MAALRDTMKGLVAGTVVVRNRDDLKPRLQMAVSGRHCVFFEADQHGRHACNRPGDDGAYGKIMCAERPGREHGIYKASTEYAQRRK